MSTDQFDVVVIGGGPAGYPAAIRAAQNGLTVACIDEWKNFDGSYAFGGTCLNAGCIPSKALLESSELYHRAHEEFAAHGIRIEHATMDIAKMQARKSGIVKQLTSGIAALFKANGVTGLQGHGRMLGAGRVEYTPHGGSPELIERLDHGDLGAESFPHAPELEPDDAAADHADPFRHLDKLQRAPGVDDVLAVEWDGLELDRH